MHAAVAPRLLIVGGGLAGAFCALQAARRGWSVTLLERDTLASGASGAAVGALHPLTGMRLTLREDNLAGFERTRALVDELLPPSAYTQGGILRLVCKERQAELWQARCAALPEDLARWLDPTACRRKEPRLTSAVRGAAWIEQGLFVDVPAFVRALIRASGADVYERCRVVELREEEAGVVAQVERSGDTATLRADQLIVATGAEAPQPLDGVSLPTAPYRGELALFRGFTPPAVPLNHRGYVVARPDRCTLVGVIDTHPPFGEELPEAHLTQLLDRLHQVLEVDGTPELVRRWSGVRPAMQDREPWFGAAPGHKRVWICTGFGGRGLLIGALTAERLIERLPH